MAEGRASRLKSARQRKPFKSSSTMTSDSGIDENYEVDDILEQIRRRQREKALNNTDTDQFRDDSARSAMAGGPDTSGRDFLSPPLRSETRYSERPDSELLFYQEATRDLINRRLSDARFDVVENKLDRVLSGITSDSKAYEHSIMFQMMMNKIKELEEKIEKKQGSRHTVSSPAPQLPKQKPAAHVFTQPAWPDETPIYCRSSNYIVEKATQTPATEHNSEGVYVLVSKKNDQPVRKVHHQVTYGYPDYIEEAPTPKSPNVYVYMQGKTKERKPPQTAPPAVRKVRRKVVSYEGYPEFICQETRVRVPSWDNSNANKDVMFLPPIPDPYSRRRPRDSRTPSRHAFTK